MRTSHALALALLLSACAAGPELASTPQEVAATRLDIATTHIAGRDGVSVQIEAPAAPRALAIFMHGVGGDDGYWAALHEGETPSNLARAGVVVAAPAGDEFGWPETLNGDTSWKTFVLDDLAPTLRVRYRLRADAPLALVGVSAGGQEALTLGFRHPDQVDCVAALSPAVHWPDPERMFGWASGWDGWAREFGDPIDAARWRARNPIALAGNDGVGDLGIFFETGAEDHLNFNETSVALSEALTAAGVAHHFALQPGRHGTSFNLTRLAALEHFLIGCLTDGAR